MSKRIALITTWFPPNQGVATNRMSAFAEYLAEDFIVEVFTVAIEDNFTQLSESSAVFYVKSSSWKDFFKHYSTDGKLLHFFKTVAIVLLSKVSTSPLKKWANTVGNLLENRHNEAPFDCIISSYAPHEVHQIASAFVKKHRGVKWIADMRDEMSKNPGIPNNLKKVYLKVEKDVSNFASALTTVSEPILEDFKILSPGIPFYQEIRNGFNHEIIPKSTQNSIFTIGYFGTFYGEIKPTYFFKALELLCERNQEFDFEMNIVGASLNFEIPKRFKKKVNINTSIPYLDAINKMMTMDVNLLVNPRTSRKGVYTGKLFDYLSAGKPILAFVDKTDVASRLINECEAGYVAEFDDVVEISHAIEKSYVDWKEGKQPQIEEGLRKSFHRREQVNKLKNLIYKIVE